MIHPVWISLPHSLSLAAFLMKSMGVRSHPTTCQNYVHIPIVPNIVMLTTGDMLFHGTVLSVIAEELVQGVVSTPKAVHLNPCVLYSVCQLLENPGNANIREIGLLSVTTQVFKVLFLNL